jgi:FkbM family methyltransferase
MTGRLPSRRALAAAAKLKGYRLERRWPYMRSAGEQDLNLQFEDLLELQRCRTKRPVVLVVGAFDGATNDPTAAFIAEQECRAILIEPQPGPFARLSQRYIGKSQITVVNAAIDERTGTRELFTVADTHGLPNWTEQLGSFDPEHVLKHSALAPGLARRLVSFPVRTLSFYDLLDEQSVDRLDVLQIDAEGMDAALLRWFPFERIKPNLLHYEITHMSASELESTRLRLRTFGYCLAPIASSQDDVAILA